MELEHQKGTHEPPIPAASRTCTDDRVEAHTPGGDVVREATPESTGRPLLLPMRRLNGTGHSMAAALWQCSLAC
jgi:hypothetical protein